MLRSIGKQLYCGVYIGPTVKTHIQIINFVLVKCFDL